MTQGNLMLFSELAAYYKEYDGTFEEAFSEALKAKKVLIIYDLCPQGTRIPIVLYQLAQKYGMEINQDSKFTIYIKHLTIGSVSLPVIIIVSGMDFVYSDYPPDNVIYVVMQKGE